MEWIYQVYCTNSLTNLVVVHKKNEKLWVYIDLLNKACLKDSFPLPKIDMLVNITVKHELLNFIDVYSSYNQILIHLVD